MLVIKMYLYWPQRKSIKNLCRKIRTNERSKWVNILCGMSGIEGWTSFDPRTYIFKNKLSRTRILGVSTSLGPDHIRWPRVLWYYHTPSEWVLEITSRGKSYGPLRRRADPKSKKNSKIFLESFWFFFTL